eukprot:766962-Hanusia_phi.AAC.4
MFMHFALLNVMDFTQLKVLGRREKDNMPGDLKFGDGDACDDLVVVVVVKEEELMSLSRRKVDIMGLMVRMIMVKMMMTETWMERRPFSCKKYRPPVCSLPIDLLFRQCKQRKTTKPRLHARFERFGCYFVVNLACCYVVNMFDCTLSCSCTCSPTCSDDARRMFRLHVVQVLHGMQLTIIVIQKLYIQQQQKAAKNGMIQSQELMSKTTGLEETIARLTPVVDNLYKWGYL